MGGAVAVGMKLAANQDKLAPATSTRSDFVRFRRGERLKLNELSQQSSSTVWVMAVEHD